MKKIMAFVLSIMMILTVAPGLAMAAQTDDAHVTYEEPTYLLYEDFEDELEGWRFVDADEDGFEWTWRVAEDGYGEPYEGEGFIQSHSYDNSTGNPLTPDNWVISPKFEVEADAELSFYVMGQDADWCEEHYGVYLFPEGYVNDGDAIKIYEDTSSEEWEKITVALDDYAGETMHVAFRHYNVTDMFAINIDLVTVSEKVDEGELTYFIYEDFEDELEGWRFVDADEDGYAWMHSQGSGAYEGEGYLESYSYDNDTETPLNPDNWVISPKFEVEAGAELSFYVEAELSDWSDEHYGVYLFPEGYVNDGDAIKIYEDVSPAQWEKITLDLGDYVGETMHVAFRHYNVTDMFAIKLDLITVSALDISDPVPVTGVTLDKTELDMVVLEETQLTATVAPEDATNKKLVWTTSDEEVATVSETGLVTAVKAGTATITVTTVDGDFTATCEVTVTGTVHTLLYEDFEDELEGWSFVDADEDGNGWEHTVVEGADLAYEGIGHIRSYSYDNDTETPLTPDNWIISPMFEVKADAELSFYVQGSDPDWCEEHYGVYLLPEGYTNLNEAIEVYDDISSEDWERIVVELDEYVGQKVHVAFRHYDITDMFMIKLDLVSVIAVELPPAVTDVTGVTLDKTEAALKVGETVQLTATVAPEDATNKELVWTTSDAAVATVSETGLVTAVAAGTATITVTTVDGEFTATCAITVTEAEPEYMVGDVNGDGVVNTGDAVMILRHVAELIELTPEQLLPADANKDGVVNTGDAVAILRFAAGIITEF